MRKPNLPRRALALWASLACAGLGSLAAQTTFASSSDPSAALEVERAGQGRLRLRITQRTTSAGFTPVSPDPVLRDDRTGIAYRPAEATVRASADGLLVTELTFAPLDGDAGEGLRATLADAYVPSRGLRVAAIHVDGV